MNTLPFPTLASLLPETSSTIHHTWTARDNEEKTYRTCIQLQQKSGVWIPQNKVSENSQAQAGAIVNFIHSKDFFFFFRALTTAAIHVTEALGAVYLCQRLKLNSTVTVAWTVQTFAFGIFSLWYLIYPKREVKESSENNKGKKEN